MKCPFCNSGKIGVQRTENTLNLKHRRRYCKECKKTFPTIETIVDEKRELQVFKKRLK